MKGELIAVALLAVILACLAQRHLSHPNVNSGGITLTKPEYIDKWFEFQKETGYMDDCGISTPIELVNNAKATTITVTHVILPPESARIFTNWLANRGYFPKP